MKKRFLLALACLLLLPFLLGTSRAASPAVKIAFLGDVMLGRDVARQYIQNDRSWGDVFELLQPALADVDLVFANLESPACQSDLCETALAGQLKAPAFQAGEQINLCAPAASKLAFEQLPALQLSEMNNHRADCLAWDRTAEINTNDAPVIWKLQGIKLAFLQADDISTEVDMDGLLSQIAAVRGQVDWVVVSLHWGAEYQAQPSPRQELLASQLLAGGADILWGHHPHVLQRTELIQREGMKDALVMYSLGNAVFDQPYPQDARQSALIQVTLGRQGQLEASALPFEIDPRQAKLVGLTDEGQQRVLRRMHLPLLPPLGLFSE